MLLLKNKKKKNLSGYFFSKAMHMYSLKEIHVIKTKNTNSLFWEKYENVIYLLFC